jgi:hypothetical protein
MLGLLNDKLTHNKVYSHTINNFILVNTDVITINPSKLTHRQIHTNMYFKIAFDKETYFVHAIGKSISPFNYQCV